MSEIFSGNAKGSFPAKEFTISAELFAPIICQKERLISLKRGSPAICHHKVGGHMRDGLKENERTCGAPC